MAWSRSSSRWEAVLAVGYQDNGSGLVLGSVRVGNRALPSWERTAQEAMSGAEFVIALWRKRLNELDLKDAEELLSFMRRRDEGRLDGTPPWKDEDHG